MDNKYLPTSRYARDPILEKMVIPEYDTFICHGCNGAVRKSVEKVIVTGDNHGRKQKLIRCIYCRSGRKQ